MAQRKQLIKNIYSDSQRTDETIQEEESAVDGDNEYENSSLLLSVSSSREKHRKEREDKSKPKEMTEEEMMDLALRLSEKEASVTALQQQQEEEEVMKAIQESMVLQTQPCLSSSSKTLLSDTSLRLGSRRKLSYSNGERLNIVDEGLLEDSGTPEVDMSSEAEGTGGGNITSNKKRKRRAGSPLLKMPDLSQSQKVSSHSSQNSPCSSESFSAPLNSSQSSDSTHIGDSQLQKSPVFPLTGRRAVVHVDRLGQDLVETCRSSGFVLCSQDSLTFSQKSVQPRSPTFPQTNPTLCSRSPVFSETNRREDRQTEPSPDFSRNSLQEMSPTACRLQGCETSALVFSSQESLTPPGISCSPKSPVFPQSPHTPKILPPSQGLSISESSDRRKSAQNNDRSMSPVFGIAEPQRRTHTNVQESESPPAVQLQGPNSEEEVERREDPKSAGCSNGQFNSRPPKSEQPNKNSKHWNSAGMEQMSGMMLVWTDEDEDDDMPVDSPSPVFPEDRPVHQSDSQAASLNHDTTEKKPEPDCSPKTLECVKHTSPLTSSASTSKQQLSTTEEEPHPISRREAACRMPPQAREQSSGPTVHYYWGVPFCPQGLDPDRYTQVILAQMEVYEKSLKQAQRCLLRKVEWGEAIHPQPEKSPSPEPTAQSPRLQVPRRRGLRLRGRKTSEAARSPPAEEEEEEEEEEQQQQEEEGDEKNKGDEEQMETDDCDVCPETQLSDNDSTHLTMVTDDGSQKSPELPEAEMILQSDSPARDEQQEEEEEEAMDETKMEESASGCRDGAGGHAVGEETEVKKDRSDPDVEEIKNTDPQRSASPELEAAVVPHSPKTSVDCPICQGSFPVSEIELHAAYCDGEVAVVSERRSEGDRYQESVKLRRKRARRAERAAEETNSLSNVCRKQEKCFICQKDVPLRDYSRHTELCCLRHTSRTTKGNLLSALEQTENRTSDAGPSGSKLQPEAVIDLRDDDDEDEDEAAGFRVSNSPIRSFTSISEAAGCLIDFKKQQRTKKPYQRRR